MESSHVDSVQNMVTNTNSNNVQLSEADIENIQVVDDVANIYTHNKTTKEIPLPFLRNIA